MPIYEYACQHCGYALEARQKFSDPPLHQCPACEQDGLERLISESSFALKGSGWYADGYGGKSKAGSATPASDASSKSEPAGEASASSSKSEASSAAPSSSSAAKSD